MLARRLVGLATRQAPVRTFIPQTPTSLVRSRHIARQIRFNSAAADTLPAKGPGIIRTSLKYGFWGALAFLVTFVYTSDPVLDYFGEVLRMTRDPIPDSETLEMYEPESPEEREIEDYINAHPLAAELRSDPEMIESRPHLKMPALFRHANFTGNTLMGKGRVTVPPVAWADAHGKSITTISHLGTDMCGHPGIVHGGFLATMLDEGLARCCFAALPHNVGMTATLTVNYKAPARADSYIVLRATTTKVEGRKAWVEGRLETLPAEGEQPVVIATAEGLFISPKNAEKMANVYSVK